VEALLKPSTTAELLVTAVAVAFALLLAARRFHLDVDPGL
jgi:hypothetical protein